MGTKTKLLLVDDDDTFRKVMNKELSALGYQVSLAATGEQALETLAKNSFDVALLDIRMPGMGGLAALEAIKERDPDCEVIILTGYGTLDDAVKSMKLGAYDYVTKPCPLDELESLIAKAHEKKMLKEQNVRLRQALARREKYPEMVGESSRLKEVMATIEKVAPSDYTVLIQGESGTGKELVARAIHQYSLRAQNPLVVIDCASLHENLLESELFGHEKGAYTGAASVKPGLFEVADSGTLFLDEVAEVQPAIQAKLLRVLETSTFRRLGGTKDIETDVRIIAATNCDLSRLMEEGKFRKDLFYRLNVIAITTPPLRERKEDIPLLAQHFAEEARVPGKQIKEILPQAMEMLMQYPWPGNIRELQNVMERAVILCEDQAIGPRDLPDNIRLTTTPELGACTGHLTLEQMERNYIESLLRELGGHRAKVAKILGISERNLYRKIKEYNLGYRY